MSIRTPQDQTRAGTGAEPGRWSRLVGSIVEAALSPHPVDRYLELLDPMITWRDLRGEITRVERPTSRTVRLTIRPTRQWRGHEAGQFVQLKVVIDGVRHTRCFSPANAAAGPHGEIELTITAHDDGFVSTHLREHARAGDVVGLSAADGEFVLPDTDPTSAVFVSGERERTIAETEIEMITQSGQLPGPVVTKVLDASEFWPAESFPQNYYRTNPIRYKFYREGCGRDERLKKLWGEDAAIN